MVSPIAIRKWVAVQHARSHQWQYGMNDVKRKLAANTIMFESKHSWQHKYYRLANARRLMILKPLLQADVHFFVCNKLALVKRVYLSGQCS